MINDLTLPDRWEQATLREVCSKIVDGSHNPPKKQSTGLPMLSAININHNRVEFTSFRLISEEAFFHEKKRTSISPGDVLLTIVGAIGRAAIVTPDLEEFTLQRSVAVLKPVEVSPKFLMYQLESPSLITHFNKQAKGTAQKGIYLKTLGSTKIVVSPIEEQHRIVAKIEELFSEIDKGVESLETAKAQLQVYRQALLKHAFEGKLTAQWRADNPDKVVPAEQLLEQIKQAREERYQQQLADWQTAVEKWEFGGKEGKKPAKPRKAKELPTLTAEEISNLSALPDEWQWIRVSELGDVQLGRQRSPKNRSKDFPTKYIRAANITSFGLDLSDVLDMEFKPEE